jgi:hypothetical protein
MKRGRAIAKATSASKTLFAPQICNFYLPQPLTKASAVWYNRGRTVGAGSDGAGTQRETGCLLTVR